MLNIQLYAGPGTGKSTSAAGLFYQMKTDGKRVELIQEFAKDLTYGKDYVKLSDQLHILGEQHHRMFRMRDNVDFIIHDSPFIQGLIYMNKNDEHLPQEEFTDFCLKLYNSYNNLNIFLVRDNDAHPYQEYGRSQKLHEAEDKDRQIKALLDDNGIPYIELTVGPDLIPELLKEIEKATNEY